ncbi:MAG: methyltransferase [Curvibacter sp.]|jgi:demethylspheroidene O-methyltransferase|nr:methyltransferase domain-containing protein [Curvibacter sp.]
MSEPLDLRPAPVSRGLGGRWSDRWQALLERLQASPALYRWSLGNPLTRWVTQRRTQRLFDLMAGFVHSQVVLACVRLDLFRHLYQAPADGAAIARHVGLPEPALQRLLLAAVALGLLEHRSGGRYGLAPLGLPLATHPGLAQMIEHNHLLYEDMRDPLGMLRNASQGSMAGYWPYAHDARPVQAAPEAMFRRYSELMAASQGFVVQEILSSYNMDKHRCVLDVGAGLGRFALALGRHAPHLQLMLFDLPPVLALTRAALADAGLRQPPQFHPGSFLHDDLPAGADLVTLVRVAHDHPDRIVRGLLKKIHNALPPGGTLLLAEPMGQPADARPAASDAYFHFYLLAMGAGRLRTPDELGELMGQAGFRQVERLANAMPIHAQILIGRKA